jgi:hypothetical protein
MGQKNLSLHQGGNFRVFQLKNDRLSKFPARHITRQMAMLHDARRFPIIHFDVTPPQNHNRLTPCDIGHRNDRIEVFTWIRSLHEDVVSKLRRSQKIISKNPSVKFSHRVSIYAQWLSRIGVIFDLFFDLDFANVAIFPTNQTIPLFLEGGFPVVPSIRVGYTARISLPNNSIDFKLNKSALGHFEHPFFVIARAVDSITSNPVVAEAFDCQISATSQARNERRQMQSDFLGNMTKLTSGSIQALLSQRSNMGMFQVGSDQSLYSFSCVFPWCVDLLDEGPNCAMTDTTFKILKPYTLSILTLIFANESIPIALSVSPTEETSSCLQIYEHVIEILSEQIPATNPGDNLLTQLPLVSDMGKAIQKLVREKHLCWLFCHRHLIESVGSHSFVGDCVRRLLRCCSEDEYLQTREVIMNEIDAMFPKNNNLYEGAPRHFRVLLMMMEIIAPDETHSKERWARWLRVGCPTTRNALESFHGHLNAHVQPRQNFVERLKIVMDSVTTRYNQRNDWVGTARRRNRDRLELDPHRPWISKAQVEFYRQLHSRRGDSSDQDTRRFRDPPHYLITFTRDRAQADETDKKPPGSWLRDNDEPPGKHNLSLNIDGAMSARNHQAYRIALALCRSMKASDWSEIGSALTAHVLNLSYHYAAEDETLTPVQEAAWRVSCWRLREQTLGQEPETGIDPLQASSTR